ncbi:MAG TPA: preprotein translocase subunit YajC [Rhodospirillaceae bacterium]|nr:preprotein translocase subunit YajC [Rhodospirillaceae bacterium]
MNLINQAFAAEDAVPTPATTTATTAVVDPVATTASTADPLFMNIAMVLLMGVMFYLLLIRPQQKRYKEHNLMLGMLDKGNKVITQGGLVGVIEKNISDSEVLIDFGNGVKMSVMRSYILGRYEDSIPSAAANDASKKKDKSSK